MKKDFVTRLLSSTITYEVSHPAEEIDTESPEVVRTGNGLPTFDELTEGSGYSSLTSAGLLSDTGFILRDGLTSVSAESSHLLSSIGTFSIFSSYSSINESLHLYSSEAGKLDGHRNQEVDYY